MFAHKNVTLVYLQILHFIFAFKGRGWGGGGVRGVRISFLS